MPWWPGAESSGLLHYLVCFLCFLAAETWTADRACKSLPETPLPYSPFLYLLRLWGECVISSVLSCHSKHLKRRTLKPSASQLSGSVTAPCYSSVLFGKYIHELWGHADPKDAKRREKEREGERQSAHAWERNPRPSGSPFYVFSPPPGPALCKLG